MSGEALKIGSMQSASLMDSLRQVAGQFANEKALPVLAAGFPTEEGEVTAIKKKFPKRTSHFPRVKSIHAVWKLLPCVGIYSGFCYKIFSAN
jgi:hypothetical protein